MVLTLIAVGKMLEARSKGRATCRAQGRRGGYGPCAGGLVAGENGIRGVNAHKFRQKGMEKQQVFGLLLFMLGFCFTASAF